jgi:hypothetical protein
MWLYLVGKQTTARSVQLDLEAIIANLREMPLQLLYDPGNIRPTARIVPELPRSSVYPIFLIKDLKVGFLEGIAL